MVVTEYIDKNLVAFKLSFKLLGTDFGNRMTIAILPNKKLWVHSPIQIDAATASMIKSLGDVTAIIAPNLFHYSHITKFLDYFPEITIYGVNGIQKKLKISKNIKNLEQYSQAGNWLPDLESIMIKGVPKVNEVVFFHQSTQTLILTDLLFHFLNPKGWSKCVYSLYGINNKLAFSSLSKLLIQDKKLFKESIENIVDWDFNKIIVSHGELIKSNGKEKFIKAFKWLLN